MGTVVSTRRNSTNNSVYYDSDNGQNTLIDDLNNDIRDLINTLRKAETAYNEQRLVLTNQMASGGKINTDDLSLLRTLQIQLETTKALVEAEIQEKKKEISTLRKKMNNIKQSINVTTRRRQQLSVQGGRRKTNKKGSKMSRKNLRRKTRK